MAIILMLVLPNLALAVSAQHISNLSRELLLILKWDQKYEQERQNDVDYLLGSIDGEMLKHLTVAQKEQVIRAMRAAVLNQMLIDKDRFKSYLLSQYNQFFTTDELKMLINYYKTDMMQMVVQAQLDRKPLTIDQINIQLLKTKTMEKQIIRKFGDSYLSSRYKRFQEKTDPKLQKMIMERLQEVIASAVKALPQTIKAVSADK